MTVNFSMTTYCILKFQIVKQSHIILNFLAMECKIKNEHIDIIWQAAQLKHCSKQVHDLLHPLINHLEAGPVMHLYNLLCKLEPKEHTQQVYLLFVTYYYFQLLGPTRRPPLKRHLVFFLILILWEKIKDGANWKII